MKYYIFLIFLILLYRHSNAQNPTVVSGYYVTNVNDTVNAQIKLPKYLFSNKIMLIKFKEKVELIDSTNKRKVFKVNEIKGFGFVYNDNKYQFLSKNFGRENAFSAKTHGFYQALILGQKSNLYHRLTTVDANDNILGIMYFLEKPNGENTAIYLFSHSKPEFIRSLLKQFYKDKQEIHPLIDSKFQSENFIKWQNEIMEIVQTVNKL